MKLRHPFLVNMAGLLGAVVLKQLLSTLDVRKDFGLGARHPTDAREGRFIYVFWHENLILPTQVRSSTSILISTHADGELIARAVRHLGFGVVRGSSTRGGAGALRQLVDVSRRTHLCITPDGPRGPRRQVQPGAVFVASQTGLPIIPVGVGYANAWRARSWDRFAVPKPFSSARFVFGEPISVPPNLEPRKLLDSIHLLQERLTFVTEEAESWAAGKRRSRTRQPGVGLAKSA